MARSALRQHETTPRAHAKSRRAPNTKSMKDAVRPGERDQRWLSDLSINGKGSLHRGKCKQWLLWRLAAGHSLTVRLSSRCLPALWTTVYAVIVSGNFCHGLSADFANGIRVSNIILRSFHFLLQRSSLLWKPRGFV